MFPPTTTKRRKEKERKGKEFTQLKILYITYYIIYIFLV
jgi:hypothetical protein